MRPPAISDVRSTLLALVDRGRPRLEHVVFLSVVGADRNRVIPHAKVEAHVQAGPVPYTFLRAGFFAQNLLGRPPRTIRDTIRDHRTLFG